MAGYYKTWFMWTREKHAAIVAELHIAWDEFVEHVYTVHNPLVTMQSSWR